MSELVSEPVSEQGCNFSNEDVKVEDCSLLTDFLSAEEADIAGPSDFIMTRGNPDDEEEEAEDSDTDDIDHSGERRNPNLVYLFTIEV